MGLDIAVEHDLFGKPDFPLIGSKPEGKLFQIML
jgi:hypothetical protein